MKEILSENFVGLLPDAEANAVLVLMHGYGANERDMLGPAREYAEAVPGLACFSLRAPFENEDPALAAAGGRQWFSLEQFRPWEEAIMNDDVFAKETDESFDYIEKNISEMAALCKTEPARTFVAGFSQGAVMAAGYAHYSGKKTLGAIAYSGLAAFSAKRTKLKAPTLVVHGTDDDVVPIALFEKVKAQLEAAKIPSEFLAVKGLGHSLNRKGIEAGVKFIRKIIQGL
jgi:phospholipase/carboxylesterase